jgi:hypothetical protein
LLDRLEPRFGYLSTDEFFTGFDQAPDGGPVPHLRWGEFQASVKGLRRSAGAWVRPYDWEAARVLTPQRLSGRAWLIEGLFSLRPEMLGLYDLAIWVQGRLTNRLERVARRDGAHMLPHWESDWMPREIAYVAAHRPWLSADIVVSGADLQIGELGGAVRGAADA